VSSVDVFDSCIRGKDESLQTSTHLRTSKVIVTPRIKSSVLCYNSVLYTFKKFKNKRHK